MNTKTSQIIVNKCFDEERALYAIKNSCVRACTFAGEADGESALKECRNIEIDECSFSLRYPLWHANGFDMSDCAMDTLCRAPIWYSSNGRITSSNIEGTKALRECSDITLDSCTVRSDEFGWRCRDIEITNCRMDSVYFLFECKNVSIEGLEMSGKYSFQYNENLSIKNSYLDTKDAFWHAKNVTVENSTLKGEYLAWFSEGLTLKNCHIIGTQPFCYCKDLKLINCTMESTDLSFEYSDVEADVKGHIDSVKNPRSGYIKADSIGEIIHEDSVIESACEIITK